MHVAVQGHQRLPLLNKTPHSNAADMNVERDMVDHLAVKGGAVKIGIVGRGVKKKQRVGKIIFAGQKIQIIGNRSEHQFAF